MQRKLPLYLAGALAIAAFAISPLSAIALTGPAAPAASSVSRIQQDASADTLLEQAKALAAEQNPTAPAAASSFAPAAGNPLFVGVDDSTIPAYLMDITNSATIQAFVGTEVWGSAYDAVNDRVLFNSGTDLYEWPVGGAVNLLGTMVDPAGASLSMVGLAFYNGQLYASRNVANEAIYAVNTTTLVATVFIDYVDGDLDCGGLSADPNNGTFYCTNDDSTPYGLGLVIINPDASVTVVAPYPAGQTDIDGLAISDDGFAYLVTDEPGSIYVYDLTGSTYVTPLTAPWTTSEVFSAGAYIPTAAAGTLLCNGSVEGFETSVPPSGWTVQTSEPAGPQWGTMADCGESGNFTNGTGGAACVSSDIFGGAEMDTSLVTPAFSLVGFTAASLDYTANYQNFGDRDFLDVDISTNGGMTWVNLLSWNEDHGGFRVQPGEDVSVDLSAYAGQSGLQLRYRYYDPNTGDYNWYAQIDNVALACSDGANDPNIDVSPLSMASTQATNTSTNQLMNIANTGGAASTLNWGITEENLPRPTLILPTQSSAQHNIDDAARKHPTQHVTIGDNALTSAATGISQSVTPQRPATPDALVTITHSTSQTITSLNSVGCNAAGLHTDNSYLRVFDLAAFGLPNGLDVTEVEIGVEEALGATGSQPLTVNLYVKTNSAGPLTWANLTSIGTASISIADQALTVATVPVAGSAGAGSILVVEVFTPEGQTVGNGFFIGSNNLGQTAPSYIAAADCGITEPTDTADIGFPGMHIVMNVTGNGDLVAPACTAPNDMPWLSLSPTNGANAGGTNTNVTVTFDSTGYGAGVYTGNVCVNSNDPDAGPGNGTDLVIVPVEMTVTAAATWTVTPTVVGGNGTTMPNTPQSVPDGGTTAFTLTPDAGYEIDTVTGCGGTLAGNVYTTGPITADCTVSASFRLIAVAAPPRLVPTLSSWVLGLLGLLMAGFALLLWPRRMG